MLLDADFDADLMQKILLLLFVIVLLSRICCLMQTLCGVICFLYTDKVDLSYVSRGKLLCCVETLLPANPRPITVMEDMTIEAMPIVVKKCEWVNRRNSAMFVMTCWKKLI